MYESMYFSQLYIMCNGSLQFYVHTDRKCCGEYAIRIRKIDFRHQRSNRDVRYLRFDVDGPKTIRKHTSNITLAEMV